MITIEEKNTISEKERLMAWLDRQIENIEDAWFDEEKHDKKMYIRNLSAPWEKEIHICSMKRVGEIMNEVPVKEEDKSEDSEYVYYYIIYRGYKVFGTLDS